ncbi:MAG: hypothetical protein FJ134_14575 [Deltaproteobacteria bacterium]|nr:hypothetical protein [Deltaproteobacteria bacterium]
MGKWKIRGKVSWKVKKFRGALKKAPRFFKSGAKLTVAYFPAEKLALGGSRKRAQPVFFENGQEIRIFNGPAVAITYF